MTMLPPIDAKVLATAATETNRGMGRTTPTAAHQLTRVAVTTTGVVLSRSNGSLFCHSEATADWVRSWRKTPDPVAVPARQLEQLLHLLDGKVTVEIFGGSWVRFSDDNGSSFELVSVEVPPEYAVYRSVAAPVVMPGWSLDAARSVAFAASEDWGRPILRSVNFDGSQVQATDSYRLARHTSETDHPIQGMVPAAILGLIEPDDSVWQSSDWFEWGHTGLHRRVRTGNGDFPAVGALFPDATNRVRLPLGPLLAACKAASAIGGYTPLELTFKMDADAKARCRRSGATTSRHVPCYGYDGPTMTLGFNPDYLAESAGAVVEPDGHVAVSFSDMPLRPVVFGTGPLESLVMPVRLEE
ncbi:MAG: hypothetical protein GY708_21560 [Actinomycetia bacterium]|nr:hypothetical protein [Actinomycetes bacterium]